MSQFPIDKTDDWEARQDAKRQVTPIPPPIPEDLQALYEKAKWHNAEIAYTSKHKPHPYDNPTTLVTLIERIAKLTEEVERLKSEWEAIYAKYDSCPHTATCACSHDEPSDVCGVHAPQLQKVLAENTHLKALLAQTSAVLEERDKFIDAQESDLVALEEAASRATRTPPQEGQ